jgi:four helix bundle protein
MGTKAYRHTDLEVFQLAFQAAMRVFELSQRFPREERYSLTDQIRRASRSVCTQIAEGWQRRRYGAVFVNKMSEAEGEAAETQAWIQFSVECEYMDRAEGRELYETYNSIIGKLIGMITHSESWILPSPRSKHS